MYITLTVCRVGYIAVISNSIPGGPQLCTLNLLVPTEVHYMKSSDAKASKSHLKFSSKMIIFIKLVYLS